MPHTEPCDLFVIGAGSAGVRLARQAAQRGARVVVAETSALGGTCVNVGCIPKKLYSFAAHFASDFADAAGFGWKVGETALDWDRLKAARAQEITRLNGIYGQLLQTAGVHVIHGRAEIAAPGVVAVGDAQFLAKHIAIATGGRPSMAGFPGHGLTLASDAMFDLPVFPKRLVVVGGGYIASEFASIFHGLGAEVDQVIRGAQILRGFDEDVARFLAQEMHKKGVRLHTGAHIAQVELCSTGERLVRLTDGRTLVADAVLVATGREPNTAGLGLERLGVALGSDGAVQVDSDLATNVPGLYALGDVVARLTLTPVALAEAMVLADHLFGDGQRAMSYEGIPSAVFTHPSLASVGLNESRARQQCGAVRIYRSEFRALKHTLSGSDERTMVKLIVDAQSDRVVGLHMVGADAGEVVQGFAVAMKAGATKAHFDATLGIHPTVAEEFVTLRTAQPE